jgi:hypothetical protein
MAEHQDKAFALDTHLDEEPVQKEKKPRTQAQIDAWNKAQQTRIENAKLKKETKVKEYVETKIETLKKKLPKSKTEVLYKPPPVVVQEEESDEEEEPEVVVVRVPKKKVVKPKPKKQIRIELEEEEFSDEDPEPITKPKVAPQKAPPKPVQKESPVGPRLYFV